MNCSRTTDLNIKTLHRIVALLFALAGLAERASFRSRPVRWSVLWLLLPGEVIARDYIAAVTGDPRLAVDEDEAVPLLPRDSSADAMRLAQTFRALASILATFLAELDASRHADAALGRCAALAHLAAILLPAQPAPVPAAERRDSS